jgi:predicted nucleotidyltransferase
MLYIDPEDKVELLAILAPVKQYDIQAYGSRAKGTNWKFSDLDLCFMREMPWETLDNLREKFTESDLPFFVSIVPWSELNDDFKKLIQKDLLPLDQW